MSKNDFSRRKFLKGLSLLGAGLAGGSLLRPRQQAHAQTLRSADDETRFLIVLCATGGASIIDGLMAIRASESDNASTINCFEDGLVQSVAGSPFRAVDLEGSKIGAIPVPFASNQSAFVKKHYADMMVATYSGTSVNHAVAQRRAVTGNEAWAGRTLQEVNAQAHGGGRPLPNVHLVSGTGFTERGNDASLSASSFGEPVSDPSTWPLSLHGVRGIEHSVGDRDLELARNVRNDALDAHSRFSKAFGQSPRLRHWQTQRQRQGELESSDLITRLMMRPDSADFPLSASGLSESPSAPRVRQVFPNFGSDPLEAQAALAYLLLANQVSVSVTLGVSFDAIVKSGANVGTGLTEGDLINPPIAFDFSHQGHRATQAFMWDRIYRVADGLIELLKGEEYANGQSFWDRTMIYVATDFGRSKKRPENATEWGSGHDLNNGILAISPLVAGNRVLGGVNPNDGNTYGFDLASGAPQPGRTTSEAEIFAGLTQALNIDQSGSGLPNVSAMRR